MSGSTFASGEFWLATAERAVKTLAQTAVSLLAVGATGVLDVDWVAVVSASLLAALISVLTSIASDAATGGGPSLTSAEVVRPDPDAAPESGYAPRHGEQ